MTGMLTMAYRAPDRYCQGVRGELGVKEGAEDQPGSEVASEQWDTRG